MPEADGNKVLHFNYDGIFLELLDKLGKMPLPPYIKEELTDKERYQTVYSRDPGSAAAPTAGLHFTPELLQRIADKGVSLAYVTLHVGLGTFRPVKEDNIADHPMHSGVLYGESAETADIVNRTHADGGRVICCRNDLLPDARERCRAKTTYCSRKAAGRISSSIRATASRPWTRL